MARILWYFFGDIDCFMRGGRDGTNTELADVLAALPDDGQAIIDNTGVGQGPPGMADVVSLLVAAEPNRNPNVPVWSASEWPDDWEVNFVAPTESNVDHLVIQPNVVAFKWPPNGGSGLNVNLNGVQPLLSDPHTIRYGDLLMQTIDFLVVDPVGRQAVIDAADGGPINDVDLVALIKKTQPELASGPKALPASFTANLQELRQTTKTYLDVNTAGGVHMRLGFKPVPGATVESARDLLTEARSRYLKVLARHDAETQARHIEALAQDQDEARASFLEANPGGYEELPGNVMLSDYPCGGFTDDMAS